MSIARQLELPLDVAADPYQTGQPLADIAATLGISITSVTACIRRAGLPRRRQANQP